MLVVCEVSVSHPGEDKAQELTPCCLGREDKAEELTPCCLGRVLVFFFFFFAVINTMIRREFGKKDLPPIRSLVLYSEK